MENGTATFEEDKGMGTHVEYDDFGEYTETLEDIRTPEEDLKP